MVFGVVHLVWMAEIVCLLREKLRRHTSLLWVQMLLSKFMRDDTIAPFYPFCNLSAALEGFVSLSRYSTTFCRQPR